MPDRPSQTPSTRPSIANRQGQLRTGSNIATCEVGEDSALEISDAYTGAARLVSTLSGVEQDRVLAAAMKARLAIEGGFSPPERADRNIQDVITQRTVAA